MSNYSQFTAVGDDGADYGAKQHCRTCKAPVNHQCSNTQFYELDTLPATQLTTSKH